MRRRWPAPPSGTRKCRPQRAHPQPQRARVRRGVSHSAGSAATRKQFGSFFYKTECALATTPSSCALGHLPQRDENLSSNQNLHLDFTATPVNRASSCLSGEHSRRGALTERAQLGGPEGAGSPPTATSAGCRHRTPRMTRSGGAGGLGKGWPHRVAQRRTPCGHTDPWL